MHFLCTLDSIVKFLHSNSTEIIIWGDFKTSFSERQTVVKSLKKLAISMHNHFETLHHLQRSTGNATPEMEKTQKASH